MKLPLRTTDGREQELHTAVCIGMSQFVDIIEIGKEKTISNEKAAQMLSAFIPANSGNENDTFDENKIVDRCASLHYV